MQRTYKSKKDTGGGLDPREVLFSLDDKSSAFDAFYIQNIKQTKRELSCMGTTNQNKVASYRIRKRKYVRRIVKEIEPALQESMSKTTYLTPDKSIHVNKGIDLFDQLLKGSPDLLQPHETNKENLFDQLRLNKEKKSYVRKMTVNPRTKKFNCSSSDSSEYEKENQTDLRNHELIIEKVTSPRLPDDSINQMVNNISVINNIIKSKNQSQSFKRRENKSRLSNSLAADAPNSPLCSTPFMEKYRGKSIYRFSPIAMGKLDDSYSYNEPEHRMMTHEIKNDDDIPSVSPILTSKSSLFSNSSGSFKIKQKSFRSPIYTMDNSKIDKCVEKEVNEKNQIKHDDLCKSSIELTPFFGFTQPSQRESVIPTELHLVDQEKSFVLSSRKSVILKYQTSNLGKETSNNSIPSTHKVEVSDDMFSEEQSSSEKDDIVEASVELEPFLGFTESAINNKTEVIKIDESDDDTIDGTMVDIFPEIEANKTDLSEYLSNKLFEVSSHPNGTNELNPVSNGESTGTSNEDFNSVSSDIDDTGDGCVTSERESLYDTCNSIEIENETCFAEVKELMNNQPIVVLNRINDSIFKKYYKNISDSNTSEDSRELNDSNDNLQNKDLVYDEKDESMKEINEIQAINSDIKAESTDSQSNKEEEYNHINFVTTRRRHEVTNESIIIILDDSNNSISSSEGNKTVLSNHDSESKPKDSINSLEKDVDLGEYNKLCPQRNSVTIRRESKILNDEELRIPMESNLNKTEVKPPIVLQPGKKWERSLSIYRRMTMQSDLEQSILEDEDILTRKGRKYRESIMHTMEMQDSRGPLHNESFSSFRSSVVSKPHRSTIRLTKEPNVSSLSLSTTAVFDDLTGFLAEDCDDTVIELSKLSIGDAHEVTVVESQDSSVRGSTAREYVLRRCNQTALLLFDECYPDTALKNCHKIGEGVYGEVFLWRARDGHARVMKVVPIAGSVRVNGERQKDYHEVVSEIVIAMELSALRAPIADIELQFDEGKEADTLDLHTIENATDGFNEVLAVRCVTGSYPSRLLDLWELYDECKGSENDNPAALPPSQQYVVLELANAGQDLEGYQFNNAEQAYALFLQVAFTLAVGEEAFQFEHRDLHWGNVLIAPTEQKYATYVLRGRTHRVPRRGVAATIIDYSLSRLSLPLGAGERAALYNDLATDDGLFDAVGDYQFEVYRLMRDKLGNDWKNFEPYTNILWLHYTADKMITALRYKRTNTKLHKHFIAKLKGVKNRILDYRSAVHFVLTDNE